MKNLFSFVFIAGIFITYSTFAQTDELTLLKKQVNHLKQQNQQLQKSISIIKLNSQKETETLTIKIKELESSLKLAGDTLDQYKKVAKTGRNISIIAIKSLRHRKTLFIWGAIVAIFVLGGACFYVHRKYKNDLKKQVDKDNEMQRTLSDNMNQVKEDISSQITKVREAIEQKINEQEKKINDLKK